MLYVVLGIIYLLLLIFLGVRSIKNGHWTMFVLGFFSPLFWIIGGLVPPTAGATGLAP